ncbi:hypothetical protein [Paraburkholderia sp. GAS348]|uniref:hypothetical protein n=1 Tax=Paraburkholderia sp. GAS348 TaxID=3035132 RepID=UPI003D1A2603
MIKFSIENYKFRKRSISSICITFVLFLNVTIASGNPHKNLNPGSPRLLQRNEIGAHRLAEIESKIKNLPDLDVHHHRILSIVEWGSGPARGTVVAASEGVNRTSSCSILEQFGTGEFEVVTGGPFCHFVKGPVGQMTNDSGRVEFSASIRQWYDGPPTTITFELIFNADRNIFCDPASQSEKFRCRVDTTPSN